MPHVCKDKKNGKKWRRANHPIVGKVCRDHDDNGSFYRAVIADEEPLRIGYEYERISFCMFCGDSLDESESEKDSDLTEADKIIDVVKKEGGTESVYYKLWNIHTHAKEQWLETHDVYWQGKKDMALIAIQLLPISEDDKQNAQSILRTSSARHNIRPEEALHGVEPD